MQTIDSKRVSRETPSSGAAVPESAADTVQCTLSTALVRQGASAVLAAASIPARRLGRPPKAHGLATGAPAYLVLFRDLAAKHTLGYWAAKYLAEEVYGLKSPNTLDAKSRDLAAFVRWFVAATGDGRIEDWLPRDTQMYLDHLEHKGRAPATINRVFATLRHFARWANEQPGAVFSEAGLPTRRVKELDVAEADCQKLHKDEVQRMFAAADWQVTACTRKNQRPRRNRAILAVLYYTGLRVSELVALRRDQYDGRYLLNVRRKGKARSREIYVSAECRRILDDYLEVERPHDASDAKGGALLTANASDKALTRRMIALVLERIAAVANAGSEGEAMQVHPHRLRHTFGAEYRERTGSDTETAMALGHTSLEYVGRYVRRTRQERERIIDGI